MYAIRSYYALKAGTFCRLEISLDQELLAGALCSDGPTVELEYDGKSEPFSLPDRCSLDCLCLLTGMNGNAGSDPAGQGLKILSCFETYSLPYSPFVEDARAGLGAFLAGDMNTVSGIMQGILTRCLAAVPDRSDKAAYITGHVV